ncbi:MAG: tRNA 4-thiouridine(8) synthase ThiI [Syntrophobacterales bacterium]|jgi:tRNA U34 2-thiouridine synthase MnmA/TrmU|nr:tRNA 4-thiouridine(8) synthase ThiI [Syntrophobacterales bacterium]
MNRKAISLISGGLDSILATKLVMEQGVEVVGFHFTSPFSSRKDKEGGARAIKTASELGIDLITRHKENDYLEVLKNPKHGYGKNMNPCIDCRIYMLKITTTLMEETGASFVVTGEVLGQRPMSQRRETIRLIEKESGLEGLIVRPLSAMRFTPTIPELEGLLDRDKLLGITGRSRNTQYNLARKYNLQEFSKPGGGCLLTDPIFSVKLKELFREEKDFTLRDIDLLSIGRHFRLMEGTKLIVGRDKEENEKLRNLCSSPYIFFSPVDFRGPEAILKGPLNDEIIKMVGNIIAFYGKNTSPAFSVQSDNGTIETHIVEKTGENYERFRIQERGSI